MANITGTDGNDTLRGTEASTSNSQSKEGDDDIKALSGDDLIIGSSGSDVINGGAGIDTLDYSNLARSIGIGLAISGSGDIIASKTFVDKDKVTDVETIIGTPSQLNNRISTDDKDKSPITSLDVDLSKNRLTYSSQQVGTRTLTVKNFTDIFGSKGNDKLKGDDFNNSISGNGGDDLIIGTKGNDGLRGNTIDYRELGAAVTISPLFSSYRRDAFFSNFNADKDISGNDAIFDCKKIIGAIGKDNTINGDKLDILRINQTGNIFNLNVNLAKNSLEIVKTAKGVSTTDTINIVNFTSFVGTGNNDTIVGANKNGKLTGGGGNDTITGGNKNDIITGSDSTARGVGEVDTLTGGGGRDKFVLGDKNGAYYVGKGKDDYATITDFNLFQDSIDLGGFKDYSFASAGNNSIELYSGKDVNTRDLIAKIQLTGGISSASSNSRSIAGSSSNLDSIISKIDILSGTNNT